MGFLDVPLRPPELVLPSHIFKKNWLRLWSWDKHIIKNVVGVNYCMPSVKFLTPHIIHSLTVKFHR